MKRVGIVVALPAEAATILPGRPPRGRSIDVRPGARMHICGVGEERAGHAARALVAEGADGLLSWGTAGALVSGLAPGTLLLPGAVVDKTGNRMAADIAWLDGLQAAIGGAVVHEVLASVGRPIGDPTGRSALRRASGAVAVDMETAAVASVAAEQGLPWCAVRAIADPAGSRLPVAVQFAVDPWGAPQWPRFLAELALRPVDLLALARLFRYFRAATEALARAAERLELSRR